MKVWIGDQPYDTSLDWTFREERTVYRLTELRPGQWWSEFLDGSTIPVVAAAIVGWMRAKPNESPDFLVNTKAARPEEFDTDGDGVLRLKLDFTDEQEEVEPDPPAEGAAAAGTARRGARRSAPKT